MTGSPSILLPGRWRLLTAFLVCCIVMLTACRTSSDVIATLVQFGGKVEREKGPAPKWEKVPQGTTFLLGDAVRTLASSNAKLKLFDKSDLSLEPNTLVRFLAKATGQRRARFDVEMGQATLEVADEALNLDMQVGTATIEAHGKVRIIRAGNITRIEVVIGSARLLTAKETIELQVGAAVDIMPDRSLQRVPAASAPSSASAEVTAFSPDASVAPAIAEQGASSIGARPAGPEAVDFVANAGESFVIHDPKPPTTIGLMQSKCPTGAILRLDAGGPNPKETQGAGRVSIQVPKGSHRYVVACLKPDGDVGEHIAQGMISVLADDGSRTLARTAPVSNVDTDGRRYTVLYQGLLPGIAVRWPNPPEASSFTLSVRSSSGSTRKFETRSASHVFHSGSLLEGEHVLTFEGGGRHSKPTNVALRFDNAARTASISSPADGSFAQGASVLVAGTASPGWTVSIGGQDLAQDGQNRFSQEVAAPSGQRALWIRFSHPGRGVHYYLRRSGQ